MLFILISVVVTHDKIGVLMLNSIGFNTKTNISVHYINILKLKINRAFQ